MKEELRESLLEHRNRYPRMQVEDAVKLLYQGEFGGGHMIANPQKSLERLKEEWESVKKQKKEQEKEPPYEEIGEKMCRMNLSVLERGLAPETLNQMFVQTADRKIGSISSFQQKLELLVQWCRQDGSLFPEEAVRTYIEDYKKKGCPAVSHSEIYRTLYQPAYRVVSDCYTRYWDVFCVIDHAVRETTKDQVWIAIDGMCGSGKSTMGRILKEIYGCNLFHMDDFFLRPKQRTNERLNAPGGNVDYERFKAEILDHGNDRAGLTYQNYDCGKRQMGGNMTVPWNRLNIVEGSYSQHPYFGDFYDLRFFCWIGEEEQIRRIRERNGEGMLKRFKEEWIPMENRYFESFGIRKDSIQFRGE